MLTKFTALAMGVLLSVSAMAADMATLTRQAQSGDAAAQSDLADEYYKQGNHAKAFEWYTNAAHQGFAEAQNDLGWMYEKGLGVRQDDQRAVEWFTKAAHQGHAQAQFNLGVMYDEGKGVRQNESTAKRYFGQACDNGYQSGCDHYRILNEQGY
jgi:tetratricopeptide repeat family protein